MKFFPNKPILLYSYLATEMLAPFFAAFVVMNGVFFLVKLIPFLNFALELSIGFADFVRLFCYMFPNMFLYTIPMASMMGIIVGFSRLSNDTEILALKASGISMAQIIPPVIIIAAVVAIFTSYFSIKLIPVSEIAMKQLTYQLLKEKIDKGIKEYQFTEALGDLVVHVKKIDKETGEWQNVWVSDMRGQVNPTITMSATGKMKSDLNRMMVTIVLYNGSLHRPDKRNAQIVKFDKYTINIPLRPPGKGIGAVHRGTLTMNQLLETADSYGLETKRGRVMLIEYHKRLALPVGCLIMSILGLPLGLQAGPGKKAIGIPIGLGIFILYYVLLTMAKMLAKEGGYNIAFMLWLPNIIFLVITLYCIQRVSDEKPLIPEWIINLFTRFSVTFIQPVLKVFMSVLHSLIKLLPEKLHPSKVRRGTVTKSIILKGDLENHIYHYPLCELYDCENCTMEFSDPAVAKGSGFSPCELCSGQELRSTP